MKTPISLKRLIMRNFLSYGNNYTSIDLDFYKPILVTGKNYDSMINGQVDSNGAGKTTILNALSWALYDKVLSKIEKKNLINNDNKKNLEVIVYFEKDGIHYKIHRFRKCKALGGDGIIIKKFDNDRFDWDDPEAGKDITENSINLANKQIEKVIALPFDIFSRVVVFSANFDRFFSLPTTSTNNKPNQRDIIEEICGYTEISEKAKNLKQKINDTTKELTRVTELNDTILKQKAKVEEQIKETEQKVDEWYKNKEIRINQLNDNIEELKSIDFELQQKCFKQIKKVNSSISEIEQKLSILRYEIKQKKEELNASSHWEEEHQSKKDTIENQIKEFDGIDFEKEKGYLKEIEVLNSELSTHIDEQKVKEREVNQNENSLNELEKELKHLESDKCPYCLQKYEGAKEKIESKHVEVKELKAVIKKLNKSLEKIDAEVSDKENRVKELESMIRFKSVSLLESSFNKMTNLKERFEELTNESNPYQKLDSDKLNETVKELEKEFKKLERKIIDLKEKRDAIEEVTVFEDEIDCINQKARIDTLREQLDNLKKEDNPHLGTLESVKKLEVTDTKTKEIEALNDDIKHMSFLYKLLTKKDSFIRKTLLNKKIPYLNTRLKYYLDSMGLPHKVEFTEEMTASISQFGKSLPYENLSNGQEARLNLALSLAFRDVLQSRYGKISFCIMDECLDVGLGSVGVQQASKMLKKLAVDEKISMFIISHRDEIASQFDDILEIELKNKFSNIKNSDIVTTKKAA